MERHGTELIIERMHLSQHKITMREVQKNHDFGAKWMKIQYRLVHGLTISSWHVIILLHLFDNLPFLYKLFLLFLFCFYFIFLSHRSIQTRLTFLLLFSLHNKYHTLHLPYDEIFLIFIRILEKKGYTTNNINRFS